MRKVLFLASIIAALPTIAAAEPPPIAAAQLVIDSPATYTRARTRTIYLNHTGATLTPGQNDSQLQHSSLITAPVTIPPWNASPTLWADTVSCMREIFAPFDVAITDTDPGDVPHVEAIFGGSPSTIGMTIPAAGVSPFSTTCSIIESSIVFTFTDNIPQNARVACEVMAQEIAHSYGLDHELLADPRLRNDDARAIVRDLDVLRIDPPRVTDMWRAESISATRYDDLFLRLMNPVAGRDRALFLRGVERFLATYETQCSGASLRVCADRLRGLALVSAPDSRDDDELLVSSWDPDVVRERFIAKVYADRLALWIYVDRLAKAEARLDESRARAAARAAQP